MKEYQKMETPKGLELRSHFFIQNKGWEDTRIECYVFTILEDMVELPNGWNVAKSDHIVIAQAHVKDNYNEVSWSTGEDVFWRWFNRFMIIYKDNYEIYLQPIKL